MRKHLLMVFNISLSRYRVRTYTCTPVINYTSSSTFLVLVLLFVYSMHRRTTGKVYNIGKNTYCTVRTLRLNSVKPTPVTTDVEYICLHE